MTERATIFGEVADTYDRFRPGYPESLVALVATHAVGTVTRAVEVGAGTGKATVLFASEGIEVLAVEPDTRMSDVLAAQAGDLPIQLMNATYEEVDPGVVGPVDLVFAASAFHWTDPETRWERTARLLRPGGVAAFFGATVDLSDESLSEHVEFISQSVLGVDTFDLGAISQDDSERWPASDLRQRDDFVDVLEMTIPVGATQPAQDFVAHLSTVSAYRVLTPVQRDAVLSRIRAALPDIVEVTQDVTVHMARRA